MTSTQPLALNRCWGRCLSGPVPAGSSREAARGPLSIRGVTVAVAVKVYDGIVLAADSATTSQLADGSHQVYNNANKVFQLHRTKPVGAMTWGLGSIGSASIATLAKDIRQRFMGLDAQHTDWELDDSFTVHGV